MMSGWPIDLGPTCFSSPVMADLDGDGIPEIFVGAGDSQVHAFHVDGTTVTNFPLAAGAPVQGTPTLQDLDLDGNPEIVVGTDGGLVVIDVKNMTEGSEFDYWWTDRGGYHRTGGYGLDVVSREATPHTPQTFMIEGAYPNPFNPSINIRYGIPSSGLTHIAVYDALGRQVALLSSISQAAGWYTIEWHGESDAGPVPAGVYFVRIQHGDQAQVQKITLLK